MAKIGTLFAGMTGATDRTLLERPAARTRHYPVISVDDHLLEPPDMFAGRLPSGLQDRSPEVITLEGIDYWSFDGVVEPISSSNAPISWSGEDWGGGGTRFDEVLPGAFRIKDRIADMDINGVIASLSFPSMCFGFCGQRFMRCSDPVLGLATVRAYNDWIFDEWYSPFAERIIPSQLPWLPDCEVAADEIRKNATRGFRAVTFSENPEKLGLPSIHSGYWDPFFRACEETETVINLHVGSSSDTIQPASDSPPDSVIALVGLNSVIAASEWVYSGIALKFPRLKIALSESGIDWIPWLIARLETQRTSPGSTWPSNAPSPVEVLQNSFWFSALWDRTGFTLRHEIGLEHIMVEVDYPHADSTFPDTQEFLYERVSSIPDDEAELITFRNAAALYRHPLPADLILP